MSRFATALLALGLSFNWPHASAEPGITPEASALALTAFLQNVHAAYE